MKWDDKLTSPHLEIAKSDAKTIGVLAGPGTGKTRYGLIRRVARLLSQGTNAKRILLLSFTRTAAADLKSKIADLNVENVDEVQAMTLHSFCYRLLNKESVLSTTKRTPRMLLDHEVDLMLRDLVGDFGDLDMRRKRLDAFEAGWARDVNDYPGQPIEQIDKDFEAQVFSWLRHHRGMLIGEVVPIAYKYLRDNPEAEEHRMFDHIIVDEYQDLNFLEQSLLDLLTESNNCSLCIAGDDDQSIYGFRYAHPKGILDFIKRENVENHMINVCGRCPQTVLKMANSLIGCTPDRKKPPLESNHPDLGNVILLQWPDLETEINGIVTAIITDIKVKKKNAGDILVLTNRSKIGTDIRKKLREQGINVNSYFNEEAVMNDSAQEALALLELICAKDRIAIRVLLGAGDDSGRKDAYKRLTDYALSKNMSELDVLEELLTGKKVDGLSVPALISRYKNASSKAEYFREQTLEKLVDELFPPEAPELADIRKLALDSLPFSDDCNDLLERISNSITQVDVPQHPDFVRVMSLHKSKGLTSPIVYVVGVVEGIIPTIKNNLSDIEIEEVVKEQRRLFYVALTRASDQLVISNSITVELATGKSLGIALEPKSVRNKDGKLFAKTVASRYLSELGPDSPRPIRGVEWITDY